MDITHALETASALINAGYNINIAKADDGSWSISAGSSVFISQQDCQDFATAHGVSLSNYTVSTGITLS